MITETDRYFVERKYHDPEKEFDAFKRMAYHGIGYIEESGIDDVALLNGLEKLSKETENLPHPVSRAMAIKYVLENERLYINEHDYFVGLYSLNRLANNTTFYKWEHESRAYRDPETLERSDDFNRSGAVMIWTDYDHVVPDWKSIMELGFVGIRDRARGYKEEHKKNDTLNEEMSAFFEGIEIQYTAIIELIDRMYRVAEQQNFAKAATIATCLKHLRDGAPTSFYEALQLIYLYFIISESIDSYQVRSLGNGLDNTLYGFYKNDLASGKITKEDARNYLSYFLMQWSAIGNYWGQPFYLGGTNLDGSTKYNELSYEILDVYDELEIYNPKIQLKINENTPDEILMKAFDMIRRKNASLVFCCEPAMIKAIMGYGATYEEAINYDIRGCYETGVRANEVSSTSGYVNAAKAVAEKYGVFGKGYALDIRDEQRIIDVFNDIDSLDRFVETVVLNSADLGFGTDPAKGMDFFTVPIEEFQRVFETNLVWNFMIVRQAALRMRERHKGAIVFIGSNTSYRAIPNRSAYSASKGGINAMSKAFAIDLGPYGIRSNVVLPGTIKTARWVEMGSKQIVNGSLTPIGDISDFEDIANAAWYLGSDESKNVTGTELAVDGGMSAQLYPQILNELKRKSQSE